MVTRTVYVNKSVDVDIDVEVDLGDFDAKVIELLKTYLCDVLDRATI